MSNDVLHRLPPPPLFTVRPPPKPPGAFFEHFATVHILNGQCVFPLANGTSALVDRHPQPINWLNLFLLILAVISIVFCMVIAVFIVICLKKLKTEEKQYHNYVITGSLSRPARHSDVCTRSNEHYKCTPTAFNCCDDYYSHQLIPLPDRPVDSSTLTRDNPQHHQYECIPEYLLTMTRPHRPSPCSIPYATFSRSLLRSQATPMASDTSHCTCSSPPSKGRPPEEATTPLLAPSVQIELVQSTSSIVASTRRKPLDTNAHEQRFSLLSPLRNSSALQ